MLARPWGLGHSPLQPSLQPLCHLPQEHSAAMASARTVLKAERLPAGCELPRGLCFRRWLVTLFGLKPEFVPTDLL